MGDDRPGLWRGPCRAEARGRQARDHRHQQVRDVQVRQVGVPLHSQSPGESRAGNDGQALLRREGRAPLWPHAQRPLPDPVGQDVLGGLAEDGAGPARVVPPAAPRADGQAPAPPRPGEAVGHHREVRRQDRHGGGGAEGPHSPGGRRHDRSHLDPEAPRWQFAQEVGRGPLRPQACARGRCGCRAILRNALSRRQSGQDDHQVLLRAPAGRGQQASHREGGQGLHCHGGRSARPDRPAGKAAQGRAWQFLPQAGISRPAGQGVWFAGTAPSGHADRGSSRVGGCSPLQGSGRCDRRSLGGRRVPGDREGHNRREDQAPRRPRLHADRVQQQACALRGPRLGLTRARTPRCPAQGSRRPCGQGDGQAAQGHGAQSQAMAEGPCPARFAADTTGRRERKTSNSSTDSGRVGGDVRSRQGGCVADSHPAPPGCRAQASP